MSDFNRISRRGFLRRSALLAASLGATSPGSLNPLFAETSEAATPRKPIPVILATDIGDDIDDTWALGFLLKCPELDLKLAVTDYGKPAFRAKLLAKFLQTCGRADVPVGVGPDAEPHGEGPQADWVKDYDLGSYPGKVHSDGVQAIVDTIMSSPTPVTLIGIGPPSNIAAALTREPRIAGRARFVGMHGSVRLGYGGSKSVSAEWNIRADAKAARQVLSAGWDITITPLDTCGLVSLAGARYQRLLNSKDPLVSAIIANYRIWNPNSKYPGAPDKSSTTLFDTVAVYLVFTQNLCELERLGIRVTDDGYTRIDDQSKIMSVATRWKNLDAFKDLLTDRLLEKPTWKSHRE
jgi:inosine-uridine nucleoside N-ribohydrolase